MRSLLFLLLAAAAPPEPLKDPRAISVHPFAGRAGTVFTVTVRGDSIRDATAVWSESPAKFAIEGATPESAEDAAAGRSRKPMDLLRLRVEAPPGSAGRHSLRLVTPRGLSNAVAFLITTAAVTAEPPAIHDSPDAALPLPAGDAVVTGRIARRGETDLYYLDAQPGQTLYCEAASGLPAPGAPGGNANGFDPSLSLWEPTGSWFDPRRLNRIAYNDEPLWVLGQPTDAVLAHRFTRAGRYYLRVEAFSGQGGPDYSYVLKLAPAAPEPKGHPSAEWSERSFLSNLAPDRLNRLAARGAAAQDRKPVTTYDAGTPIALPALVQGVIAAPRQAHRSRFRVDGPADIAIEVQTPRTAPPLFNPVVRLLKDETEVATNILAGRGACTGALTKSLQPKVVVPIREAGDYELEVRDATADAGDASFHYRVLIRPQVPHLGRVAIDEDRVNLTPGGARTIRITFDREEDFRGAVAIFAEDLPPGVQAAAGADFEPDKDPPLTTGKRERYIARAERTAMVFTAAADAPVTPQPVMVKLRVRPVDNGKPGDIAYTRRIPLMVVNP